MTKEEFEKMGMFETSPGIFEKINNRELSFLEHHPLVKHNPIPLFYDRGLSGTLLISFPVDPMGKPRMTQQDRWKKRDVTDRYWELKDHLVKIAKGSNFEIPDSNIHIIFYMPMADSWAKSKKEKMDGKPHQQRPDADNMLKAIQDSLCKEDSYIWDVRISKYWAYKGRIDIYKI
jgi:Holliday junction resolvase RusA-like endonuclease